MKLLSAISLALIAVSQASPLEKRADPHGIDVSSYQGNVNWAAVKANGIAFVYIKATEGTGRSFAMDLVKRIDDWR
jgi:GH25 family lysozyme M1 (1,4-beta-N-acetylmuramidase)